MKTIVAVVFLFCVSLSFAQQATPPNILVANNTGMSCLTAGTIGGKTYLYIAANTTGHSGGPADGHFVSTDGGATWSV